MAYRRAVRVALALRAHDIVDLLLQQLGQHPEPGRDAQRQQPLLRCPNQRAQRPLHPGGQHGLLSHRGLRDRYGLLHGGSSFYLSWITPRMLPTGNHAAQGPPSASSTSYGQPQGSPLRCQHDAHGSPGGRTRDQWVLPAIRATTHVDGKPIRSSRRARRGAGCWLRRTIGASGRTPMLSGRMTWRRASAARRPLIGRACPDGRRGGGGVRSGTLRTITRCSTAAAGVRPRSRSPARARAARSRVVRSGRRLGPVETPAYQRSSCAAAQGAFQPLLRFVQRASDRAIKRGARDDSFRQGAAVARWASTARPERSRAATTLAAACRGKASVIPLLGAMCRRPCRSARAPSWR